MLKKTSCRYMLMWPTFEKLSQTSGLSIIILIHVDVFAGTGEPMAQILLYYCYTNTKWKQFL